MADRNVALCLAPLASPDGFISQVEAKGFRVSAHERLCSPEGLELIRSMSGPLVVAACGPDRARGLLASAAGDNGREARFIDLYLTPDEVGASLVVSLGGETVSRAEGLEPVQDAVLVVGGGVGGCRAALDLAEMGILVYLVEKNLGLGGIMARLDKTFPTLDCSICILGPILVDAASHPLIEVINNAQVTGVEGSAGAFRARVRQEPFYVDQDKCSGCGACAEVCPVILPSTWNLGMKPRKAVRVLFEQAVPLCSAIDRENCIECRLCEDACERKAINFDDEPRELDLDAGAIILAAGAKTFDPARAPEMGYGTVPGVITNLELERVLCATGPTGGEFLDPRGRPVESVAFIQCVGSRDMKFNPYCSGYCCTASVKEAMMIREHAPDARVHILYNDLRTAGKGFEELALRAREEGIEFIRGLAGKIVPGPDSKPEIIYEDMKRGELGRLVVDLAVLAVGLEGSQVNIRFGNARLIKDGYGFIREPNPFLRPLYTSVEGIFTLGTVHGPRDISETASEASGAAAEVAAFLGRIAKRGA